MRYTAAAVIARDAIDTSSVIALANRTCLLGAGPAAAAEIAALDAASAALLAQSQIRQTGSAERMAGAQSERLSALLEAARVYDAMRQQDGGLERDAAAGAMIGATFARALCAVAELAWCPACRTYQAPEALHICTAPAARDAASPGVALRYDRAQGTVVVSHGDAETAQDLGALLAAMGITFADVERALAAAPSRRRRRSTGLWRAARRRATAGSCRRPVRTGRSMSCVIVSGTRPICTARRRAARRLHLRR